MLLVGLDPYEAKHICLAHEQGLGTMDVNEITIDGKFAAHRTQFAPAPREWPTVFMNYMSRYPWFLNKFILNDHIFGPTRKLVQILRRLDLTGA